ncbi:DUF6064 family protein [Bacteroides fragilis]
MEIFWKTIAYYNSATWIYQLLIIVAGLLLTVMLIKNPRPWVKMGMKLYMIFCICGLLSHIMPSVVTSAVITGRWLCSGWLWPRYGYGMPSPDILLSNVHINMISFRTYC